MLKSWSTLENLILIDCRTYLGFDELLLFVRRRWADRESNVTKRGEVLGAQPPAITTSVRHHSLGRRGDIQT